MDQLPMFSSLQADRMPRKPVGVLYEALSPSDASAAARAFGERAHVCHADARSQALSNGTRVGAAFDVCAFVLLSRLAQQRLVFDGMPEVVERIVACTVRPYEGRVAGLREVVEKHLGRYEAPAEFSDEDVAVALEVAGLMLQDPPSGNGDMASRYPLTPVLLEQSRTLPQMLARFETCTAPDSVQRAELVANLEKLLAQFERGDSGESIKG